MLMWLRPVSLISRFQDDSGEVPPIKCETGYQGKEAERLTRFIWNQVIQLLLTGKELEANSLLEEFDEPPLWDDPLDEAMGTHGNPTNPVASVGCLGLARHHDDLPERNRGLLTDKTPRASTQTQNTLGTTTAWDRRLLND